jgi:hypothetical protein
MLHLVGLGLADEKDITVRGLEIVKKADRVYLEAYTAILLVDKAKLVSGLPCLSSFCVILLQVASSVAQIIDWTFYSVGSVLWPPCH